MNTKTLEDLYVDELKDVYNAEQQLIKALPKVAKAASSLNLQEAVNAHLKQTHSHVDRLKKVFEECGLEPRGKTCEAMKGLLEEADKAITEYPKGATRDAALIGGAQRVEHYEMAAYGTLRAFAEQLGKEGAVGLLQKTLEEEKTANEKLTKIATSEVNPAAAEEGESQEGMEEEDSKGQRKAQVASRR